jgi:ribosome biogenesis GTPase
MIVYKRLVFMNNIEKLGFDYWFEDKLDLSLNPDFKIVRVISVNKNSFVVSNGEKDMYAELNW